MATETASKGGNPNWKKGVSGNPGGRPKQVLEVIALARQHTVEAIEALAKIVKNGESEAAIVSAANTLLDRGWGKAPQHLTIGDEENEPTRAGDDAERLVQLARKVAAATIGSRVDETVPGQPAPLVH